MLDSFNATISNGSHYISSVPLLGFEYDPIMSIDGALMLNLIYYTDDATRIFTSGNNPNPSYARHYGLGVSYSLAFDSCQDDSNVYTSAACHCAEDNPNNVATAEANLKDVYISG